MNEKQYTGATCRTYAKVDLAAIRKNGAIAKSLFPEQMILSVLKADAYGHGIQGVMPAYETFTDWYAAATVEEAFLIRAQSEKPILLFGPLVAQKDITFTVGSSAYAHMLSEQMLSSGMVAKCHLKIDTGLNRSGIRWREESSAMEEIRAVYALPALKFTGTYTHLACPEGSLEWEIAHTRLQMNRYKEACAAMERAHLPIGIHHCCSTGGALVNPEFRMDMVRLGMLPMGMSYTDESVRELGLCPALTWISFLTQIEKIEPGEAVSYGCTFRADKPMKIGIVTCGYADGYRRVYSNKSSVLIAGKKVRTIGRIAMDYTVIDLTDVPEAELGMPVIMLGSDGIHTVTAQELSCFGESVSGEVTCVISSRVPRVYTNGR